MLFSPPIVDGIFKKILIVDDNEMILDLLAREFEALGFEVFKAKNGFDALDLFKNKQTELVLTDIQMPGMDGKTLSRRIRNQSKTTTIVAMSGGDSDTGLNLLKEGTVNYFFQKPFNVENIYRLFAEETQCA